MGTSQDRSSRSRKNGLCGLKMVNEKTWIPEHNMWACVLLLAIKEFTEGKKEAAMWLTAIGPQIKKPGGFYWICEALSMEWLFHDIRSRALNNDFEGVRQYFNMTDGDWKRYRNRKSNALKITFGQRLFKRI